MSLMRVKTGEEGGSARLCCPHIFPNPRDTNRHEKTRRNLGADRVFIAPAHGAFLYFFGRFRKNLMENMAMFCAAGF
jgi:hypothetical protein